jgi:hypothetical protein
LHETGLIFSRSGDSRKRYRVSPYLFPQFGAYNNFLLPKRRDLPAHGLVTRLYAFDFGFSQGNFGIPPYDTAYCPLVIGRDLLVWAVTGVYSAQAPVVVAPATLPAAYQPGANVSPGFMVNWLHTHNGVQRQWANKNITDGEACGNGRYPMILRDPALLPQGDTITCVIQNLANNTLLAQLLFHCGEFDTETYGQEAGA